MFLGRSNIENGMRMKWVGWKIVNVREYFKFVREWMKVIVRKDKGILGYWEKNEKWKICIVDLIWDFIWGNDKKWVEV